LCINCQFGHKILDDRYFAVLLHIEKRTMYNITFKFEQKGLEPITISNIENGQSILEVALKNNIDLHHNCGGVCACSTCHLYVEKGDALIEELSDKEEDFIDRAINPRLSSRLGCQCVLVAAGGDIEVTLPDQTQFLGE
jgi:ferredoxin, 2Fe-2S